MENTDPHRPTVRVLDILEHLAEKEGGRTLTELATAINASKSTILPVIRTLVVRGYISQDARSGHYTLGPSCWLLAGAAGEKNVWMRIINETMQRVVDACDEICQLGILTGSDILYLRKIQSTRIVRLVSDVGTRFPASATALGKALLAEMDATAVRTLYPEGLPVRTRFGIHSFEALQSQLADVRRRGYAVDDRECSEETVCLAVSLHHRGRTLAALSVSIPAFRATQEKQEEVANEILKARAYLEKILNTADEVSLA